MTAPQTRTVDAHTGEVVMATIPLRELEDLRADLARAVEKREGYRAELDNLMGTDKTLGKLVADLTSQNAMWHADRDEQYDIADEWRDKAERYLRTVDELQAEVDSLRGDAARVQELEAEVAELKRDVEWMSKADR